MQKIIRCRVKEILEHGGQLYSLFLEPESPAPTFLPGQYLSLALDAYRPGGAFPESRAFSIASPPAERSLLRITYAVKGQFSARMAAELRQGSQLWIKMPLGEFTINPDQDACLLAGGTGVTAFSAFLAGIPAAYPHRIHLFYGARRRGQLIYRPLVEAAAQRCTGLRVRYFAEQDFEGTDCQPGRIDVEAVFGTVPEPLSLAYYLAGPPGMIQTLTLALTRHDLDPSQVISEAWE
jgi:ferredoxin-NADP reductase